METYNYWVIESYNTAVALATGLTAAHPIRKITTKQGRLDYSIVSIKQIGDNKRTGPKSFWIHT